MARRDGRLSVIDASEQAEARAAVARRRVEVAGDAHKCVEDAVVLDGVAGVLGREHVLQAAVAVARGGVDGRGPRQGGVADVIGGNAADLSCDLRRELVGASRIVLPDRLHLVGLAVLERDLELAVDGGVNLGSNGLCSAMRPGTVPLGRLGWGLS